MCVTKGNRAGAGRTVTGLLFALTVLLLTIPPSGAEQPGRGITAPFEIDYLKFIIDHHFAALRMTELAAGTDPARDSQISPREGTSPTPGFVSSVDKAQLDEIKSIARRNNRMQREEILTAQKLLREWYGVTYEPRLRGTNRGQIEILEKADRGQAFDHLFLEVFSRHHYIAAQRSLDCYVGADPAHFDLKRYCRNIVEAQLSDIDEMRHLLCREFQICDYQPFTGLKGRHSGQERLEIDQGEALEK